MLRDHGLQNGPSLGFPPARPAHHLGQQVEGRLRRPEGTGVKAHVPVQHAHQRHVGEIQALGHHLGPQQHGDFFPAEPVQNGLVGIGGGDGVRIHPLHPNAGEPVVKLLLHLLDTHAYPLQGAAAMGTDARHRPGIAAVVAHEPLVGAVIGEPCAAPGTFRGFPAVHADQRPAVAPAVQEQDGLFSGGEGLLQGCLQGVAEGGIVAVPEFFPHVHNVHVGKLPAIEPIF